MFCTNCGKNLNDTDVVCCYCGTPTGVQPAYQQPAYQQPTYQQPAYQDPYGQPVTPPAAKPALPMGWYKFLIYFALFAGAILNVISGVSMLTGTQYAQYGVNAQTIYRFYNGLEGLDMLMGVLFVVLAVLGIVTRFQLAGYKKSGPMLLVALYGANAVVSLIYVIGFSSIVGSDLLGFSSDFSSIAVSVAMAFANYKYFKKRGHLFVN